MLGTRLCLPLVFNFRRDRPPRGTYAKGVPGCATGQGTFFHLHNSEVGSQNTKIEKSVLVACLFGKFGEKIENLGDSVPFRVTFFEPQRHTPSVGKGSTPPPGRRTRVTCHQSPFWTNIFALKCGNKLTLLFFNRLPTNWYC